MIMTLCSCVHEMYIIVIILLLLERILMIKLSMIGTSITLSPMGMVSVCPGGQALLTCERTAGSVLYWTASVPHLATTHKRVVPNQGDLLVPKFKIDFTDFYVTRTSESLLISQLLITNVTTAMNGSTIFCSEDGNENNAPNALIYNGMTLL